MSARQRAAFILRPRLRASLDPAAVLRPQSPRHSHMGHRVPELGLPALQPKPGLAAPGPSRAPGLR